MLKTIRRVLYKGIITASAIILILLLIPYLRTTIYVPLPKKVFAGESWYIPYTNVNDTLLRANFHAHSRSWAGLTWGVNSASEVINAYAEKGYQVPALSNYHKIAQRDLYREGLIYIPTYEHGFNLKKVHCLCIGAHERSFWEYPWHLTPHHTRQIIADLRKHCDLVALAHPGARHAHVPEDMPLLSGLQLMEVANTQGARTAFWDATLSSGQAIWFLANDDTHDLNDGEAFMRWSMIYAETPSAESVINSLRRGNHYGILSYDGDCEDNRLTSFTMQGDTLHIALRDTFNRLDFIGQEGMSLHSVARNLKGYYIVQNTDTYVRAEVHQDHCVMYLNPIIRYNGIETPFTTEISSEQDALRTWIWRVLCILFIGVVIWIWSKLVSR